MKYLKIAGGIIVVVLVVGVVLLGLKTYKDNKELQTVKAEMQNSFKELQTVKAEMQNSFKEQKQETVVVQERTVRPARTDKQVEEPLYKRVDKPSKIVNHAAFVHPVYGLVGWPLREDGSYYIGPNPPAHFSVSAKQDGKWTGANYQKVKIAEVVNGEPVPIGQGFPLFTTKVPGTSEEVWVTEVWLLVKSAPRAQVVSQNNIVINNNLREPSVEIDLSKVVSQEDSVSLVY